jgi:DNA-binding response OmpR family regulator
MPDNFQSPAILLVEDSEDDAFFFSRTLRLSGFSGQVVHLLDGRRAVAYLQQVLAGEVRSPDLVFLDLKIPTLSGFEVLEWIRAHAFASPLDVPVLSGSEHRQDVDRAIALGATAYYVKPISIQQLKVRLDTWRGRSLAPASAEIVASAGPDRPA